MNNNKERQRLDKYESKSERENIGYIPFPFVTPLFSLQKELNSLTDMDRGIKSLNHFIYIPKFS